MTSSTRERIRTTAAVLFRRQGFSATGMKQIVTGAAAPFASIYHFFPGGKVELGADVIRVEGAAYEHLVVAVWDAADDIVHSVRDVFDGAAMVLEASGYEDACPIATIAGEIASTHEPMRIAAAEVFESWTAAAARRLEAAGIEPDAARGAAHSIIALLEGGFLLARTARSTEPMLAAGTAAVTIVSGLVNARAARTTN